MEKSGFLLNILLEYFQQGGKGLILVLRTLKRPSKSTKFFFVANFLLSRNLLLAPVSKILNFKNFIMDWFLNLILVLSTNLELSFDLRNHQSLFL